ncbi:MAG TPA: flavodoxin family protein [Methanoregulaceae archaeon]|nr:flavodoxin family protein [Methanoregulaceae archaeon]
MVPDSPCPGKQGACSENHHLTSPLQTAVVIRIPLAETGSRTLHNHLYAIYRRDNSMNTLIIYKSYSKMNTEKVAKAMAEAVNATLKKVEEAKPEDLTGYDLIGIGSGIYAGKYHKDLYKLLEKIPRLEKDMFVFSTAGSPDEKYEKPMKELLAGKGARVVGEFRCPGAAGLLGLTWANKGHPDEQDLGRARTFAKGLIKG